MIRVGIPCIVASSWELFDEFVPFGISSSEKALRRVGREGSAKGFGGGGGEGAGVGPLGDMWGCCSGKETTVHRSQKAMLVNGTGDKDALTVEECLDESFAGHVITGRVAPWAFEFLEFCLLMHKGDLWGRWLWHRRERQVVQREGLHSGVDVEACSSGGGGSSRFEHDVGGAEMCVVGSDNAGWFKMNAVFAIGPSSEWRK